MINEETLDSALCLKQVKISPPYYLYVILMLIPGIVADNPLEHTIQRIMSCLVIGLVGIIAMWCTLTLVKRKKMILSVMSPFVAFVPCLLSQHFLREYVGPECCISYSSGMMMYIFAKGNGKMVRTALPMAKGWNCDHGYNGGESCDGSDTYNRVKI